MRKLKWRLLGTAEVVIGGGFAVLCTYAYFRPPGSVSPLGALVSLVVFGHGLLTLITGSFVSYAGSESEDERES